MTAIDSSDYILDNKEELLHLQREAVDLSCKLRPLILSQAPISDEALQDWFDTLCQLKDVVWALESAGFEERREAI